MGLLVFLLCLVGLLWWAPWADRDPLPPHTEVDAQGGAAQVNVVQEVAQWRFVTESEEVNDWKPVENGATVLLGTVFRTRDKGAAQLATAGGFTLRVDGNSEFVFQDARKDDTGTRHYAVVKVVRGDFRAKAYVNEGHTRILKIETPVFSVRVLDGEVGMYVEPTYGRIWLMDGAAEVIRQDGTREPLKLKDILRVHL